MGRRRHRCRQHRGSHPREALTGIPQLDLFGGSSADSQRDAAPADARVVGAAPPDSQLQSTAAHLPSDIRLGTSSWSFPGWADIVYDATYTERQLARQGLAAYAQHSLLRTVGIDRSYYAPLDAKAYADYANAVPPDFRFLVKAERLLVLPDIEDTRGGVAVNPLFLDAPYATEVIIAPIVEGLGDRAGPILFQFSPMHPRRVGGSREFATRLHDFLSALPAGPLYAVELRTPDLFTPAYFDALAAAGAVHAYTVHGSMLPLREQLELLPITDQRALVIRWMLHTRHGYNEARAAYTPFNSIVDADEESRRTIVAAAIAAADERKEAFVVVNNKAEGSSPLSVFALASLLEEELAARTR